MFAPLTSKAQRTRSSIIEAASTLFWKLGFHNTSVDKVAHEAKVNKATIYRHFASKDSLAIAVITTARNVAITDVFEHAFQNHTAPVDRLKAIYSALFGIHEMIFDDENVCHGCPFISVTVELATLNNQARHEVQRSFQIFGEYYRRLIEDAGYQEPKEIEKRVRLLVGLMNAGMIATKIEQRPQALLDFFPTAADLVS